MKSALTLLLLVAAGCVHPDTTSSGRPTGEAESAEMAHRLPDAGQYAPYARIDRDNVGRLAQVWTYRTGDRAVGRGRFQATPILADGLLYLSTPFGRVIALDPSTGTERWQYDPRIDLAGDYGDFAGRGVATWRDPERTTGQPCRRRIFVAPIDARLIALDADTGRPCADFGRAGTVDLQTDLVNAPAWQGEYQVTSPPAIVGDLVVVGSAIADNQRVNAPSGVVRAFDARSGAQRWRWDPIPREPGLPGYDTWSHTGALRTGAANAWAPIAVDEARDLLFVPVGSAAPDFYGGLRRGRNLYANALVALHGSTGEVVWHFQAVHHDLWDYDLPARPALATLKRGDRVIAAVVQATKMGHLFVLDRETGEPVFPLEERAVPASDVPGEAAWPTQPFPILPRPLVPARFTPEEAWGLTDADRRACRERLDGMRAEGIFTPPSLAGTIILPGNLGGSNWSGVSIDPARGLVMVPTNNLVTTVRLVPRDADRSPRPGALRLERSPQRGTPYTMERSFPMSARGLPCNPPPWSMLAAVDLTSGGVRWQVPLGTMPGLAGVPGSDAWGSIALGGALATAGGLTFVAGTLDEHLYGFETDTGRVLWKARLPAGGHATPASYEVAGRQYVVIAAGGHDRLPTRPGDHLVAFALDGAGARASPPPSPSTGRHAGDLVFGRRYPVQLDLRETPGGGLTGELSGIESGIRGELTGTRAGRDLVHEIAFELPEERCDGVLRGTLSLVNHDTMLTGEVSLTGSCADGDEEAGVLTLRRR